ncbi:MAG: DUF4266 domain-containing protein [Gammaproteobacteria bacterium]|nr:DUF4266 domain-containing protein [Gammaproteobacteria bacterium]
MRFFILLLSFFLASCSLITPVKPWERDVLARENMQLNADELVLLMDEQIYYSKEASHGGRGVGGGGCGCN